MVKPYSMDLRERVVAAVKREGLPRQAAARRFGAAVIRCFWPDSREQADVDERKSCFL